MVNHCLGYSPVLSLRHKRHLPILSLFHSHFVIVVVIGYSGGNFVIGGGCVVIVSAPVCVF